MLHEWDIDSPPNPLPFMKLESRQAIKIAEFVSEQYQRVNQLIVQSEFASSQLSAIAETIGGWTDAYLEREDIWPNEHQPTRTLLEMAFDAMELGGQRKPHSQGVTAGKDHEFQDLIHLVCSLANVTMLSSSRIPDCYAITADRRSDLDATLGACLDQEQRRDWPREHYSELCVKPTCFDLRVFLSCRDRRVCCRGGCPACLETLGQCNMPVCLAVIFDQQHLPPTFERVLEAGGNWAIITRRHLMGQIKRNAENQWEVQLTRRRGIDLGLITIGAAPVCDVLHKVYRRCWPRLPITKTNTDQCWRFDQPILSI